MRVVPGTVARLAELAKSILWCMLTGITIAVVIQWLNQYIETHKKINKIMIVCFLLFGLDLLLFNFFMPLVFNADIPDLIIRTIVDILAVASGYIVAYRTQQQS
jgi:fructose-specific phosphotransferase system IIC component